MKNRKFSLLTELKIRQKKKKKVKTPITTSGVRRADCFARLTGACKTKALINSDGTSTTRNRVITAQI